jgi:secreted Zn-dependent insulinase-like peptidase
MVLPVSSVWVKRLRLMGLVLAVIILSSLQSVKPSRYISHLVGHEGRGSLHTLLNARGWIESLSAGSSFRTSDMEVFKVRLGQRGEKSCGVGDRAFQSISDFPG